ncbi:MAG: cell division protein FtsQ/DivIB [Sideroxydans sp.]
MWDDASLLRGMANALFGLGAVLLLVIALRIVLQRPEFPLHRVDLTAAPTHVPVEALQRVVREQVRGNFFTVDMARLRQGLEGLPWVRKVSVRRQFPWALQVEIEEQVALARWNRTALVNTHGEVFTAQTEAKLPEFIGPAERAADMAQRYVAWAELIRPLGQRIAQVSLSSRYAWQVQLENGTLLELGREQMEERLARFVRAYPYSLGAGGAQLRRVDLRYRNGFAVQTADSQV